MTTTTAQAFLLELEQSFNDDADPTPILERINSAGCAHSISREKMLVHFPDESFILMEKREEGLSIQTGMFLARRLHEVHHTSETVH